MTAGPSWTATAYDVTGGTGGDIVIMTDGVEYAVMHNSSPLVLVDSATNMPLTSVTGNLTFSTVFVKGSSAAESLSSGYDFWSVMDCHRI